MQKLKLRNKVLTLVLALAMIIGLIPAFVQNADAARYYDIKIDNGITGGTIVADPADKLVGEEKITLTVTPDKDYELTDISVNIPADIYSMEDVIGLMGDATYKSESSGATTKVVDGKLVAFDNEGQKLGEVDTPDEFYRETAYNYVASYDEGDTWSFYIYGENITEVYYYPSESSESILFEGTNTGALPAGEAVELTKINDNQYTFTMPEADVRVRATFENPISVQLDVGSKHADLFTNTDLLELRDSLEVTEVTKNGSVITFTGVNPEWSEWKLVANLDADIYDILHDVKQSLAHNNEQYMTVSYNTIDKYSTIEDLIEDRASEARMTTKVKDGTKTFMVWKQPYKKLDIDNGNPTCGQDSWEAKPTMPDGISMYYEGYLWRDKNKEGVTTFEGGNEYTFYCEYRLKFDGALWKYYLDPDNFNVSIKDGQDLGSRATDDDDIIITYKSTANHDWDDGTVTKEPTTEAEGEKTFKCKNFDKCGGTKTEAIPKLKPTPAKDTSKPVLAAKGIASGKNASSISWSKVSGANKYVVYFAKCNVKGKKYSLKKVKTVSAKTFKFKKTKLKKNTAYKFYVVAKDKSGKIIAKSKVGHFFTGNVKGKYTNPKSLKLSNSTYSLDIGKTATIKASVSKVKKGKKLATSHAKKLRYTSNNPTVVTVSAGGKITAKSAGTATIYVQTINGIWKTCKVTVK